MANWSDPLLTSTYTNFLAEVKDRDTDLALQFDGTTSTNIPTGTIRWNSTSNRWQKWSGTAWGELTTTYALTGLSTTGNASIGGTLNVTGVTTLGTATATTVATVDNSTNIATTAFVKAQAYALLAGPAFTGTPTAPTAGIGTNTTQLATTAYVNSEIANDALLLAGGTLTGAMAAIAGTTGIPGVQVGVGTTYKPGIYSPGTDQLAIATAGTGRLFVDAGGRVGVGVVPSPWASDFKAMQIGGQGQSIVGLVSTSQLNVGSNGYNNGTNWIYNNTSAAGLYQIDVATHKWYYAASGAAGSSIAWTQAMTLDASGNLALGATSTLRPFYVAKTGFNAGGGWYSIAKTVDSSDNKGFDFGYDNASQTSILVANTSSAASNLAFWTYNGSTWGERCRIDSSGNLGLGVVPSAWSGLTSLSIGSTGSSIASASNDNLYLNSGAYYDGTNWIYKTTSQPVSSYQQLSGVHRWNIAAAGTAGNAITFTQAMTLDASGRLLVGTTASPTDASIRLTLNGVNGGGIELAHNNNGGGTVIPGSGGGIQFYTFAGAVGSESYSEAARFDSQRRLLVGVSSTTVTCRGVFQGHQADGTAATNVYFQSGTAAASVLSGNGLGTLSFAASGSRGAYITTTADANWTASSFPTSLVFATAPSGSTSPTPRLAITSTGALSPGSTTTNTGTTGQSLISQGSSASPTWGSSIVTGTAVASTSGTAIDFTSIPSWVERITVLFNAVSLSATANLLVQIGVSGGVETTGYASSCAYGGSSVDAGAASSTAGYVIRAGAAAAAIAGTLQISNVSGNIWVASFNGARVDGAVASSNSGGGVKTLAAVLDRVRITSTSTDTFDAGSINILYE